MDDALRIREFWFGKSLTCSLPGQGELASQAVALKRRVDVWFESKVQQDEIIRTQFEEVLQRATRGELDGWADSPRRRLSLIILLDQFPRHMYRGTAQAFAYDPAALALTLSGMQLAADGALNLVERIFFYMPLQHAEATEVQDESVSAYKRLVSESPAKEKPRVRYENNTNQLNYYAALLKAAMYNYPDLTQGLQHQGLVIIKNENGFTLHDPAAGVFINTDELLNEKQQQVLANHFSTEQPQRQHPAIPGINLASDVDDDAVLGMKRRRKKKARTNLR